MAEELPRLPPISAATRQKLQAQGFQNHMYDYLNLPSYFIPRGKGYDAYTYFIMGMSLVGGIIAKRVGHPVHIFVGTFMLAPLAVIIQKKQADGFYLSAYSKTNPKILLQNYKILKQSFEDVSHEIDEQIAKKSRHIEILKANLNRI